MFRTNIRSGNPVSYTHLSDASLKTVDYWCREFKENPCMMDALESDVNKALDVIRKAERGEMCIRDRHTPCPEIRSSRYATSSRWGR